MVHGMPNKSFSSMPFCFEYTISASLKMSSIFLGFIFSKPFVVFGLLRTVIHERRQVVYAIKKKNYSAKL